MKKLWFTLLLSSLMCASCMIAAGPHGASIGIAPPLPIVVELADPYYFQGGYHYYHNNDQWYYSQQQGGPWVDLPRDRYPKEVRYKGKDQDKGKGWNNGRDRN